MSVVVLAVALLWAALLVPPFVRSRLESDPADSVGQFRRNLRVLGSATPHVGSPIGEHFSEDLFDDAVTTASGSGRMPSPWVSKARQLDKMRRRRRVAIALLASVVVTLLVGLAPGMHEVLFVNLGADFFFGLYLLMLLRVRSKETERNFGQHFAALRATDEVPTLSLTPEELRRQAL